MRCPYCQATDTQVLDTRKLDHGTTIRRRRRCEMCGRRFPTVERVEPPSLLVVNKRGRREPRERDHATTTRRRRRCEMCGRRFTTVERVEPPSLLVVKKSGHREPYER